VLEYYSSIAGDYYTGPYELFDLAHGAYVAVVESKGYITNYQRFYVTKQLLSMNAFPLVPTLQQG